MTDEISGIYCSSLTRRGEAGQGLARNGVARQYLDAKGIATIKGILCIIGGLLLGPSAGLLIGSLLAHDDPPPEVSIDLDALYEDRSAFWRAHFEKHPPPPLTEQVCE